MLNNLILARPYANAAFAVAKDTGELEVWQQSLAIFASAANDPAFNSLFDNPCITPEMLVNMLIEMLPVELRNEFCINFIKNLALEHRLEVLPEIAELFEKLVLDYKNLLLVRVVSRSELTKHQQQKIVEILQQKFNKQIELQLETSSKLLGGIVLHIDDVVYDGSLKNKLDRLKDVAAGL
jgi:F-type H+-transporting ATPase subunit delta